MVQLVEAAGELEACLAQVALYEEAVDIADELGDDWVSFGIRRELMQAAVFSGATEKLLTAFSWCLGKSDQDPDAFPEINLLWQYKWAIAHSYRYPQISLEQTRSMLDDFEMRLLRNHLSPRPATYLRMCFCSAVGQLEEAATHAERWQQEPRDYLADCEACEMDNHVDALFVMQRDELAIKIAKPLLDREVTCAEVPHKTYARLVFSAIRCGRDELAKDYHRIGLPMVAGNTDFLPQNAQHAIYLIRLGDESSSLKIIERNLPWSLDTLESGDRLDFYVGALAVLRGGDSEQVELRLPSTHPLHDKSNRRYSRAELARWFESEMNGLVAQFDARNQNDWQTQQSQRYLALACP